VAWRCVTVAWGVLKIEHYVSNSHIFWFQFLDFITFVLNNVVMEKFDIFNFFLTSFCAIML
jgi:hypothetical protein